MTDSELILRPTPERTRKADHLADDGQPTKDQPYIRAAKLGTPWDRYCRTKNRNGNPLPDHELLLSRAQIAAGDHYAGDYAMSMWGQARISTGEPGVSGSCHGVPASRIDARKAVWKAEAHLSFRQPAMLQAIIFDAIAIEAYAAAVGFGTMADPMDLLRAALTNLAVHYGYDKRNAAPERAAVA